MTTTPKTPPTTDDCPGCAAKQRLIDQLRTTLDAVHIIAANADNYATEPSSPPSSGTHDS